MEPARRHRWDVDVAEARAIQEELRGLVEGRDRLGDVRTVAGVDCSYRRGWPRQYAAVVVLDAQTLERIETAWAAEVPRFPYVPGYLSFRETPLVLEAFARLERAPDLVICDGQGYAHPRRFGLACHLGVLLDRPTIGSAKSLLVGTHRAPGRERGRWARLVHDGEVVGEALRTRSRVRPIYASVGHRVARSTARRWLLHLAPRYRIPEPVRAAHREVNRLRRASEERGGQAGEGPRT